jgi:hypothetical protein
MILKDVSRVIALTTLITLPLATNAAVALQGKNYVCRNASYMQLWDSATSQLVKHQILLDENCWKPMKGIHVEVLDRIGKFSRIQYAGNGIVAYAYSSDIAKVVAPPPEPAKTIIVSTLDKVRRVDSMTEDKEVMLMKGKPTVTFFLTSKDSALELNVVKDVLKTGFKIHAENQQNGSIQIMVRHKKESRGFGTPDYVDFEVIERNDAKKYIDIRVSGYFNKFDRERNKDFELKPATLHISGAQYTEAIRPHTPKELANPFRDSSGRTT